MNELVHTADFRAAAFQGSYSRRTVIDSSGLTFHFYRVFVLPGMYNFEGGVMFRILFAAIGFAVLASSAFAEIHLYECKIKVSTANILIPEDLFIVHDLNGGEILVSDPFIYYINDKKPMPGKIAIDNSKRITYGWKLNVSELLTGQYANVAYRATYFKATKKMTVTGKPLGYTNNYRGDGTCKLTIK